MLLKRIELAGFKSFADKTTLEFLPGVTVVVGPNGSGKSNISDAVRWVLGEQSAKSLRGAKMEDIIFAGSDGRRAVGMAEVSMTLDNGSGLFPLDFAEVTVTRRVFRSGESEFLINKTPCRLKDIHELFFDTGVGREGFSIIGQGKVEEVLSSRSEDRRHLIEEAAGIIKYRNRKREAEKKLGETNQNLLRIGDIIGEIHAQLGPLGEQAQKAGIYQGLKERLDRLEISLLVEDLSTTLVKREQGRKGVETLTAALWEKEGANAKGEAALQEQKLDLQGKEEILAEAQNEFYKIRQASQETAGRISVQEERMRGLDVQEKHFTEELQQLKGRLEEWTHSHGEEEGKLDSLMVVVEEAAAQLAASEAAHSEAKEFLAQEESGLESAKGELLDLLQRLAQSRNRLQTLEGQKSQGEVRLDKMDDELARNSEAGAHWGQELEGAEARLQEDREALTLARQEEGELKQSLTGVLAETKELAGRIGTQSQQLTQVKARHKALKDLEEAYDGYSQGVREVLSAKEKGVGAVQSVYGVVADLIQVPGELETALDVALGGALQNLVAETDEGAKGAINYLKERRLGRATFLPLNTLHRGQKRPDAQLLREAGVVGWGPELVKFDKKYQAAVDYLLGRTIVVQDIQKAVPLARKIGSPWRLVTLDGDLINPGGAMTGGTYHKKGPNLLGRKRELEELAQRAEQMAASLQESQTRQEELGRLRETSEQRLQELGSQIQQLEVNKAALERDIFRLHEESKRHQDQEELLNLEREQLWSSLWAVSQEMENLQQQIAALEEEERNRRGALDVSQEGLAQLKGLAAELQEKVTAQRVEEARLRQEASGLRDAMDRYFQVKADLQQQLDRQERALAGLQEERVAGEQEKSAAQLELKELTGRLAEGEGRLTALKEERQALWEGVQAGEESLRILIKEVAAARQTLHQEEVNLARWETEVDRYQQRLQEDFEMTWEEAQVRHEAVEDRKASGRELHRLKEEIQRLGPVNLLAIEEFAQLQERRDFLDQQHRDLVEAKDSLYKVIGEMERIMIQRFQEAYQAIDSHFQVVFTDLFNGGKARLELTDPENLLETGIDIIAQPPGKKPQHLSLLSGGERALTAIALLFAILKVKPSPFCILDEIEASLDEANVVRFAEFLKDFSKQSQFVVISHRKGTMEVADVMYGVTMEGSGVSKLVSVRFGEETMSPAS